MKNRVIAALLIASLMLSFCSCGKKSDAGIDTSEAAPTTDREIDRELTDLPTKWDLTDIFEDEDDFEAAVERVDELIPEIEAMRGTLNSVEGILNYLESPANLECEAIMNRADMYHQLLELLDASDPWYKRVTAGYHEIDQKLKIARAYEKTEIMALPFEKRKEIFSDARLAPYAYKMRNYTNPDYVFLNEQAQTVESLMEPAVNNLSTFMVFDNVELQRPSFTYPDGKEGVLDDITYATIMGDPQFDHEFRKKINHLRNEMRQPYVNTYASLVEGQMRKTWAKAEARGFDSTLAYALDESDVDIAVYDKIISFAHEMLPKLHSYLKTKKEALGQDEAMIFDISLPITDYKVREISYEDGINIGRAGISVWGDEYLEVFDKILKSPHIDVYPSDTKQGGACEIDAGNENLPYVMYNYEGNETYISTLVHEMGHAVYAELTKENQNVYNVNNTVFTHEVTSTANELMFLKYMIEHAASESERLFWLDQEIDHIVGTIFYQCMYVEFEDWCYKIIEAGGALNADDMCKKWVELQKLYYGEALMVLDETGIDWARIPHFYYEQYYVYQYATSMTYAASICNLVDEKGLEEVDAYLSFLKSGKTASPAELLSIAGVDPMKDETYQAAGTYISSLIDEFETEIQSR